MDVDGVLLDSMGVWYEVDRIFLDRRGLVFCDGIKGKIESLSIHYAAEVFIEYFKLTDHVDIVVSEWLSIAAELYRTSVTLKPGVHDFVQRMREQGRGVSLATSCSEDILMDVLDRESLVDKVERITYTREVSSRSKDVSLFRLAVERTGKPPSRCIVFDDVPEALLAARQAGTRTVGVFDTHSMGRLAELKKAADYYIEGFHQLA